MRKILFAIACAGLVLISSAGANGQPAVYSTGADGDSPVISGDIIAFSTSESSVSSDLNGDGDTLDWVLQYYNTSSGILTNTGVADYMDDSLSISGNRIALFYDEWWAGLDLNGDGDTYDYFIMYYDISTGTLINTGAAGEYPSISGDIITFTTLEYWVGEEEDWNGDGDPWDYIIRYYDISTGTLYNTGSEGNYPSIDGNTIAFITTEFFINQDLNGDGDTFDSVVRYNDISTGATVNTGAVGYGYNPLSVSGNIIAFYTYEADINQDLSGDGDTNDFVVRYYNISTGVVKNTGSLWGAQPSVSGNLITFTTPEINVGQDLNNDGDTNDDLIMYYSISSDTLSDSGAQGFGPVVSAGTIASQTSEFNVDQDLNNDGDTDDVVITYLTLPQLDSDGDGILDDSDNCPAVANPGQEDFDGDTLGDPCDPDDDNDTIPDEIDNCPLTANQDQADNDGDGGGDLCDADDDNDGIADVDDTCPYEDATGFDADSNGCIDTLEGLISIIDAQGLQPGFVNSLLSKVENVAKSLGKGNDRAALNQLKAFINAIEAQKGKKISASTADMLMAYANNVIRQI